MPAGIGGIGSNGSFGSGTLGLDCPVCHHKHDYEDGIHQGEMARLVYDCAHCGCKSQDFITAMQQEPPNGKKE